MDDIPVRPLRFDFDALQTADPLWSNTNPHFSRFINALGVHVPYFERFLVRTMRAYRDELTDDALVADVQAIIGQEAHHAFNFVKWTQAMCSHYPGLGEVDAASRRYFEKAGERSKKFRIGFTAGYETFTFLSGLIILDRYQEFMADADPNLRAMWVWHQVEEVEHGSVAFDFYRAFYPDDEWYRRGMILFAFGHIAWETLKAYRVMLYEATWRGKLTAWRFFAGFGRDLFRSALPVFSARYHPRDHPICNERQNALAVAWRARASAGGGLESLTEDDVNRMLNDGCNDPTAT